MATFNIQEHVTNSIIASLDAGTVPWKKPWVGGVPSNLLSGKPYRGVNALILSLTGESNFLTFKQACMIGAKIRKGSISYPICFWNFPITKEGETKRAPFMRYYSVFGYSSLEEIPEKYQVKPHAIIPNHEGIDSMVKIKIPRLESAEQACYRPSNDTIYMPDRGTFLSYEGYYATLLHEISHWTGATHRLNREGIANFDTFGSDQYSVEELIAEMGSAFMCAHYGIENRIEQSASYMQSWARKLKDNRRMIITASSHAQKIMDYMIGVQSSPEEIEE